MRIRKIAISILTIIILSINSIPLVYAAPPATAGGGGAKNTSKDTSGTSSTSDSWVQDAFTATHDFLEEEPNDLDSGIGNKLLDRFSNIIRGINTFLLVLLAGISAISLSIVGVRYILGGAMPTERERAKKDLGTIFKGMAFGFGAFVIWRIAMGIVEIIITAFT